MTFKCSVQNKEKCIVKKKKHFKYHIEIKLKLLKLFFKLFFFYTYNILLGIISYLGSYNFKYTLFDPHKYFIFNLINTKS